jgi:hypothetical protein
LEEAVDLSSDRLLMMMMMMIVASVYHFREICFATRKCRAQVLHFAVFVVMLLFTIESARCVKYVVCCSPRFPFLLIYFGFRFYVTNTRANKIYVRFIKSKMY